MKNSKAIFFIKVSLLLFVFNFALHTEAAKRGKKKVYTVDFEDELIQGTVKTPSIFHLFSNRDLEHNKIIDVKQNFLPEMRRTAGELD